MERFPVQEYVDHRGLPLLFMRRAGAVWMHAGRVVRDVLRYEGWQEHYEQLRNRTDWHFLEIYEDSDGVVWVHEQSARLWLAQLRASKVANLSARSWLVDLQVRIADIIRQHFYSTAAPAAPPVVPSFFPAYSRRVAHRFAVHRELPAGYWSVFTEAASFLHDAEDLYRPAGIPLGEYDLLDGSIGIRWSAYRQGKPWRGERRQYRHPYPPGDRRNRANAGEGVLAWAYPAREWQHFRHWLYGEYIARDLPRYLLAKFDRPTLERALPVFQRHGLLMEMPALRWNGAN